MLLGLALSASAGGVLFAMRLAGRAEPHPAFGFQACYENPCPQPGELHCATACGCYPREEDWIEGPHEAFAALGATLLARESTQWFEDSPEAATWRENPTARLELVYPSGDLTIHARRTPELSLPWAEQLAAWFERFPPGGEVEQGTDEEPYQWTIDCGDRGRVGSCAPSDTVAVLHMKAVMSIPGTSPVFQPSTFDLALGVQRSSHETDVFGANVKSVGELDDLPRIVREKVGARTQLDEPR